MGVCKKCLEKLKNEIKLKPEFTLIGLNNFKGTTVMIVDNNFAEPIPAFTLFLTTMKKLKNGNEKKEISEVRLISIFCPYCGEKLK